MGVREWAGLGARFGLDAVDLSILFLPERTLSAAAAVRKQVEEAGMRVAMLATYPDFTHPDVDRRRHEIALAKQSVALAAEMGAELMRVTAGQAHPETSRSSGLEWAVEGLSELVLAAEGSGVTLVYENHSKPGIWPYTDFSTPQDVFLEIFHDTAAFALGVNFDTANATVFTPDPVALLRQVIGRVISIHAADTATCGELRPVLLGTGVVPFDTLLACLRAAGWDNWICIEEASFRGASGVAQAVDFIRQAWAVAMH